MTTVDAATAGQVTAARQDAGVADLSARGKLRVTGRDRATWLHGMVSNVVEGLEPGQGNCGSILTNKGTMIADYRLAVRQDDMLLDLEPEVPSKVGDWLNRYIISEDATLHDDSDHWTLLGVCGPRSAEVVEEALDVVVAALGVACSIAMDVEGASGMVVRTDRTGQLAYDVWLPATGSSDIGESLVEAAATSLSDDAMEVLRIEAGIPRYGVDMDEEIIPLEAQLSDAISFEKGCYVGQEIVARMHYRGHPNKLLVGLRFAGEALPTRKSELFHDAEKPIGWVTSAAFSPTLDAVVGLGYVRANLAEVGTSIELRDGQRTSSATVAETPFI